jgi:hypothetical protein
VNNVYSANKCNKTSIVPTNTATTTNNLRVHISPVGFDPANRVAGPLLQLRADKVYLVSKSKDDLASSRKAEVMRILKEHHHIEVHDIHVDIFDLFCCLEKFREIFEKEKENHVHVNVSTGSKILSIAGMLACMLWKGIPYYAKLDYDSEPGKDGQSGKVDLMDTRQVKETEFLPVYQINMPSEQSLRVLAIIAARPGEKISKKELIEELQELKIIPSFQPAQPRNAPHSRLRAILDPLETHWQFVKVEARGRRSEVSLTQQGKSALRIFGAGSAYE